ncbi:betaine aldehyde dehydrogenase [Blumeria hordei DH14]|uniref:aldehyde dehydrogenase (NAD(+)) n=1 Tax=Blumeria graminis f. sp. hordei (strain DH14) TaxID=546991 RepID=N1JBD3_BLUG1|nr:betaine aldehyde dehydrogenase [Blumeria hordei DH14]
MATYPIQQLFYDGKVQSATSGKTFKTIDPSTGNVLAEVQSASESDVDAAINAAQSAFCSWSQTSPSYRARILMKADELLRDRNNKIAEIETHDTGKPFSETSTVDIVTGAEVLAFYANLVASGGLNGETISLRPDAWIYTKKEALGICVGIGAWNYPIQIALWKSAPCLAAGNCMIYKPSEFTPLHGLILAQIYSEAGLPAGVFNLVHGDKLVGSYLTTHPKIAKVSSLDKFRQVRKVPSSFYRMLILKSSGRSYDGQFFSSGQVCTNGTRVFVPRKLQSAFEKRLIEKMQYVRSLAPMDPNSNFGPLVSEIHHAKVLKYIEHGINVDKARLIYGGTDRPSKIPVGYENGYWIRPTIFTDCTDSMKITQEEIFGPVLCILPYDTIEEAIIRANNTHLGLAAGVFGRDINMCHEVIGKLEAGITWINTWGESPAEMSVGGWKMSGLGVENGKRGLSAWVRERSTLVEGSGNVATVFSKL